MEIVLVKQTDHALPDADKLVVRRFLFGHLSGATDKDTRAWNRFVRAMDNAAAGEFFTLKIKRQRSGKFHRLHMKIMTTVFNGQERIEDFEQFRLWVKVGCGFVDWMSGPKGGVFPVPRSINFETCSEEEMHEFHTNAVAFLRTQHAAHYLWPKAEQQAAQQGMADILNKFERDGF